MTVYQLRNGFSIDLSFGQPQVLNARPAFIQFDPADLYGSYLDCFPFPINADGTPIPQTNVVKMTASGLLGGASPDVFAQCSLRFIQLIKVHTFDVLYFGKHRDEGSVSWRWTGALMEHNNDCWVSEDGTKNSYPFQFYDTLSGRTAPNKLVATLGDTPGARIPLAEFNRESSLPNYLRIFNDRRSFESIVTFVHPDKSMEILESWGWKFKRSVALKWVKLRPEVDGTNHISFTADTKLKSVFGMDAAYADTLSSKRIANQLTKEAMKNIRTSQNVSYSAVRETNILPPDSFWTPQ